MIDWSDWPLLYVRAADLPADQARQVTGQALEEALARGGPFAAVVEMPPAPPGRVRGALEQVRMVRRLRPGLAEHCRGLAFVMSADARIEHAKLIRTGPKVWRCPVHAATDPRRAGSWARERLGDGGR